jgi:serine/threonine protein kinase
MDLFYKLWYGLRTLAGLLFAFAQGRLHRGAGAALRWLPHLALFVAVLVGLYVLNRPNVSDLYKLVDSPYRVLREGWLPILFVLVCAFAGLVSLLWRLLLPSAFPDRDSVSPDRAAATRSGEPRTVPAGATVGGWPVIPGYQVLERLGEGGMGQVFKARQLRLGRVVALKIIRKDREAQFQAVRRFQREAKAGGRLSHPNIVAFYDADAAGEVNFLAMEYVKGTDLARLVQRSGAMPLTPACDCVRQAAMGLQHAHERGLVHRDIKPPNLLLSSDGAVKILDMGLARLEQVSTAEHASSELTETGTVMGTAAYMAPEQALDPRDADGRADVYSLGCTFYYLLTGRAPFVHSSAAQVLLKHQLEEPTAVEQLRPDVPVALGAVVRPMMAKRREGRYQTAAEAAAALEPFCQHDGATVDSERLRASVAAVLTPAAEQRNPWPVTTVSQEAQRGAAPPIDTESGPGVTADSPEQLAPESETPSRTPSPHGRERLLRVLLVVITALLLLQVAAATFFLILWSAR